MTVLNWCLLALEYSLKEENDRSTQALIRLPLPRCFQSHPAVLTLVSVFEGFRMTKKVDQMADSFFELAEILEFPYPKMFEDMIRASLLIMLDAKESLGEELVASQAFY
ncbi:unnamed protein product, partial [Gongylonema pulchrum]|uniref:NR LBD domain-containing protein n=1 Tax=Gongylonema pulchrum TaxID=637853 RepID=A0A183EZK6_9BILA